MSKVYMYGIDISKHNGNIDLSKYKGQFVIIRAGYGWESTDPLFHRNVKECKRLGIPFGVYWYSYALNTQQAKTEANYFLKLIAPYKNDLKMGVWFDMEDADGWKRRHGFTFNNANISAITHTWCDIVESAGYYTGIYASQSWMPYFTPKCNRFDKWTASWGANDGYRHNDMSNYGSLHQYTSSPLDKSVSYVDISRFSKQAKTTPKLQPKPQPESQLLPLDTIARKVINGDFGNGKTRVDKLTKLGYNYSEVQARVNQLLGNVNTNKIYYTVKSGDTLWEISRRYNTSVAKIARLNGIANPDIIYTGQVLRII